MDTSKSQNKRWLYNFVSGGWNSQIAPTKEEAIELATQRWVNSPSLVVDTTTFREATTKDENSLLISFW